MGPAWPVSYLRALFSWGVLCHQSLGDSHAKKRAERFEHVSKRTDHQCFFTRKKTLCWMVTGRPMTPLLPFPLLSGHWVAPSAFLARPAAQQPATDRSSAGFGFGCVEGWMENPAPLETNVHNWCIYTYVCDCICVYSYTHTELSKNRLLPGEFRILAPNDIPKPTSGFNEQAVGKLFGHLQQKQPIQNTSSCPSPAPLPCPPQHIHKISPGPEAMKRDGCTDVPRHHGEGAMERATMERFWGCQKGIWQMWPMGWGEAGWPLLDGFIVSFHGFFTISKWLRHYLAGSYVAVTISQYVCEVGVVGFQC